MYQILTNSHSVFPDIFEAHLLWTACCLGYFGFMWSGEFIVTGSSPPVIQVADLAVDSHESPTLVKVTLRWAKTFNVLTNPFGKDIDIYFGKTSTPICPVFGLLYKLYGSPSQGR